MGRDHIEGHFVMVWKSAKHPSVRGEATTQYRLKGGTDLPGVEFRSIQIDIRSKGSVLEQNEQIVLFGAPALARIARS